MKYNGSVLFDNYFILKHICKNNKMFCNNLSFFFIF